MDLSIPEILSHGTPLTKVSHRKKKKCVFKLNEHGQITYESRKNPIISVDSIRELRLGPDAKYYREQFHVGPGQENCWLTIVRVQGDDYKMLHLIADTSDVVNLWHDTLMKFINIESSLRAGLGNADLREGLWAKQYWKAGNIREDQKIELDEAMVLCRLLNASQPSQEIKRLFEEADEKHVGHLDFAGFCRFAKLLKRRTEIENLHKIAFPQGANFSSFEKFMRDVQKSQSSQKDLEVLFEKFSHSEPSNLGMDVEDFTSFLLSEENSVYDTRNKKVWQDMSRPLSEYFIASSHNTYLVGHQLVGVSTVEGYIRALLLGSRSVEMDIYDGDDDEEPMVYHGKTLTSKVSLRDICKAISRYAFAVSSYPLIISAEVHCGLEKQNQMYNIFVQTFGEKLIRAPVEGRPKIPKLPSPEEMKGKVLLKAKNLFIANGIEAAREPSSPVIEVNALPAGQALEAETSESSSSSSNSDGIVDSLMSKLRKRRAEKNKPKPRMSFQLASLLVYTVGVKCRGLNGSEKYAPEHIFSLGESSAAKLCRDVQLVKHTQDHLVRVYPKGVRVSSSNYLPHQYWAAGCQLVALNIQTFAQFIYSLGFTINRSMFQCNGKAGYVLKPEPLRNKDTSVLSKRAKHLLNVTVLSAQQLPLPRDHNGMEKMSTSRMDPFVEVSLHIPDWTLASSNTVAQGESARPRVIKFSTSPVKNNGFNPVWNHEGALEFECVEDMKELIFLQFSVRQEGKDEDDEPIALYCISLGQLEQGYRHLPLHDSQFSQHLYSTLFVKTSLQRL